jgi:RND family efflux transporter MFP subunit
MKKKSLLIICAIGLVFLAIVVFKILSAGKSADQRKPSAPIVKVETPHRGTIVNSLKFTGDIMPVQQANIFSKVSGNLERIYVDIGTYVQKGQILALIDTTELFQQYQQTSATFENTRLMYERNKELSSQNLIAKQDLDNAEAAMKVAGANFEAARIRLGYTNITAPFPGFITKRFLDAGALVNSSNSTLFTLMDLGAMKVMVDVLEKDIPRIKVGKKASVSVDAFPGKEFRGAVARMSEAVDISTRTMAVEIDIPNVGRLLKSGMYATAVLYVDEHSDAVVVPTQAILRDDKGYFVFTVNGTSVHRNSVQPGAEQNGRTEILSGLNGNENIITTGQQYVKDGGQVIIQK